MQGYFGLPIDKAVLGIAHMYKGEGTPFDPEGIASTLPAIVQVIFGFFAGNYILEKGKTYEMVSNLFVAGCVLVFVGFCWDMVFPINKKIWSSSFVVYTSGIAMLLLSVLIHVIEFHKWRGGWSRFFDVFGKNPLFIFVLSGLIPRFLGLIRWQDGTTSNGGISYTTPLEWFYEQVCKPISENQKNGSLLFAIITVLFFWLIAYCLDRRKIYLRV